VYYIGLKKTENEERARERLIVKRKLRAAKVKWLDL
jgi:hypothetical protein